MRAAGNLYAILGFLIFPFAWSIPEVLVTAELGSTYPDASGGVAWVEEAFGKFAGLVMGYLSFVSGATDTAIYPVLFLDYAIQLFHDNQSWDDITMWVRFSFMIAVSSVLTLLNYLGFGIVKPLISMLFVVIISPLIFMIMLGIPKVQPERWLQTPDITTTDLDFGNTTGWLLVPDLGGILWRPFLNNLFWSLNSFDSGAYFSEDVQDVGFFKSGMFLSVPIVVCCYIFPLLISIGATSSNQSDWVDGYLVNAATEIGGKWLGGWMLLAAGVCNVALFQAEMSGDSLQLLGMAKRGYLPAIFATRSRFGTPTYGILLCFFIVVIMSAADFSSLVEMLNFSYAISLLMEYAAFIKLRIDNRNVLRPWQIPLNLTGCFVLVTPPCLLTLFMLAIASYQTYVFFFIFMLLGVTLYFLQSKAKKWEWCIFADPICEAENEKLRIDSENILT